MVLMYFFYFHPQPSGGLFDSCLHLNQQRSNLILISGLAPGTLPDTAATCAGPWCISIEAAEDFVSLSLQFRAGNEPSRSLKLYNHGEGHQGHLISGLGDFNRDCENVAKVRFQLYCSNCSYWHCSTDNCSIQQQDDTQWAPSIPCSWPQTRLHHTIHNLNSVMLLSALWRDIRMMKGITEPSWHFTE